MTPDLREVPFKRWHYEWLMAAHEKAEGGFGMVLSPPMLDVLEKANSWTGVVDGDPVACGGTLEQWPGRHLAWAYIARGTLRLLPWITRHSKDYVSRPKGRVEMTVRKTFAAGHRWARELGFEVETPLLRAYGPGGEDHVGYVRHN